MFFLGGLGFGLGAGLGAGLGLGLTRPLYAPYYGYHRPYPYGRYPAYYGRRFY